MSFSSSKIALFKVAFGLPKENIFDNFEDTDRYQIILLLFFYLKCLLKNPSEYICRGSPLPQTSFPPPISSSSINSTASKMSYEMLNFFNFNFYHSFLILLVISTKHRRSFCENYFTKDDKIS